MTNRGSNRARNVHKIQPTLNNSNSLHKNPLVSSTHPAAVPYSLHSRRRTDPRRCGPGGRKAFWSRRNVRRCSRGGGGRRAPLAARSSERAKPATGTTSQSAIAFGRRGGLDSGPGLWRIVSSNRRWDSCRTRSASCCNGLVRAGAAGQGSRLSDADIIRQISGRARVAPPRACLWHAHSPTFRKAKPACGPPEYQSQFTPAVCPRGDAVACSHSLLPPRCRQSRRMRGVFCRSRRIPDQTHGAEIACERPDHCPDAAMAVAAYLAVMTTMTSLPSMRTGPSSVAPSVYSKIPARVPPSSP